MCRPPAIIDEIQNAPELFSYIRTLVDQNPKAGQWFLTGSQDFGLMLEAALTSSTQSEIKPGSLNAS